MTEKQVYEVERGYVVVEGRDTDLLAVTCQPGSFAVGLAILEFVSAEANRRLATGSVEVIPVAYHGAYPGLGIRGDSGGRRPTEEQVQAETDRILSEVPLSAFVRFLRENPVDWTAAVTSLLARARR
jgi:hypothetical protein